MTMKGAALESESPASRASSRALSGESDGSSDGSAAAAKVSEARRAGGADCLARCCPVWLSPCTLSAVVLLLVFGGVAGGVLYWALGAAEQEAARGVNDARAAMVLRNMQHSASRIQQSLDSARMACEGMVAQFDTVSIAEWPSQQQWQRLAESLFAAVPGMSSFLWSPRVELRDEARYTNLSDVYWGNVWPGDAANKSAANASHPWWPLTGVPYRSPGERLFDYSYYVLLRYPTPTGAKKTAMPNADTLGYADRRDMMLEALDMNQTAASVRLFLTNSDKYGILLISPTLRATPATAAQGFMTGGGVMRTVFILNDMLLKPLLAEVGVDRTRFLSPQNAGFDLWLHDVTPLGVTAKPIPGYAPGQFLSGFYWDGRSAHLAAPDDSLPADCIKATPDQAACAAAYAGLSLDAVQQSPTLRAAGALVAQTTLQYGARAWRLTMVPRQQMLDLLPAPSGGGLGKVVAVVLCCLLFALVAAFVLLAAYRAHQAEQRRIADALKAQQQAMNYMCHELRNPIHVIRFLTAEVTNLMQDFADAYALEMVGLLRAYTSSLYYMVNGFLDLAKAGHVSVSISESPTELAVLLTQSFQVYSSLNLRPAELTFKLEIAPELRRETFFFDAVRIEQVVANGLSNAAKYTKAGTITLSAKAVPASASASAAVNKGGASASTGAARAALRLHTLASEAARASARGRIETFGSSVDSSLSDKMPGPDTASSDGCASAPASIDSNVTVDATRMVRITVADTGVGIDAIDPESVFEDFAQSANKQVVQQASTGLGLPIARKLARMMGGDVRLEPNPLQRGTCFVFELPYVTITTPGGAAGAEQSDASSLPSTESGSGASEVLARSHAAKRVARATADDFGGDAPDTARSVPPAAATAASAASAAAVAVAAPVAPAAAAASTAAAPKKPLAGLRVVAAEDEPATHMILKRMLAKGGVEEAMMFFEGLELSRQYRACPAHFDNVDIMLIDMHMMYNDGLTTLRLLRDAGCTLPCIAVTGATSEEEDKSYLAAGFAAVCAKPYTAEQLFGHVLAVLRAHHKKRDRNGDGDSDKKRVHVTESNSFVLDP
jgi:signal transduction histidine kinase/FixJ family two-component response regulator